MEETFSQFNTNMQDLLQKKIKLSEAVEMVDKEIAQCRDKERLEESYQFHYQQQFTREDILALFSRKVDHITNRFTKVAYELGGFMENGSILLQKNYCSCDVYGPCGHGPRTKQVMPLTFDFIQSLVKDDELSFSYTLEMLPNRKGLVHINWKTIPFDVYKRYFKDFHPEGYEIEREMKIMLQQV